MRYEFIVGCPRGRIPLVAAVAGFPLLAIASEPVCAETLFDFFFGGFGKQAQSSQASFFADPNAQQTVPQPPRAVAGGSGPSFCVRSCDGKYFPVMRATSSPAQMCQAFCPASRTKVFYGTSIDAAYSASGERYADSENAYAYRKAFRADCTCNGRGPAGLAPVDLTLDSSLHDGDVIATTDGLVAYSGGRTAAARVAEFIPIASYPGLVAELRARLSEIKVAPVRSETIASEPSVPSPAETANAAAPINLVPNMRSARDKRAEMN